MAKCLRNIRLEGLLVVIEVRGYFVVVDVFDALGYSLQYSLYEAFKRILDAVEITVDVFAVCVLRESRISFADVCSHCYKTLVL